MGKRSASSTNGSTDSDRRWSDLNLMDCSTASFASNVSSSQSGSERRCISLLKRCEFLGYNKVAFCHGAFGKLNPARDSLEKAFPFILDCTRGNTSVFKRINVVVEELEDLNIFAEGPAISNEIVSLSEEKKLREAREILNEYDIVSVTPLNESTFSAACVSAHGADIIVLDHSSARGGRLPFALRSKELQSASELGIAFEICYGPFIVDPTSNRRKSFIQTLKYFMHASLNVRPKPVLILSSGSRMNPENKVDSGSLSFRSGLDLLNAVHVLTGTDPRVIQAAMSSASIRVLNRARNRRSCCAASRQTNIGHVFYKNALSTSKTTCDNSFTIESKLPMSDAACHRSIPAKRPKNSKSEIASIRENDENDGFLEL